MNHKIPTSKNLFVLFLFVVLYCVLSPDSVAVADSSGCSSDSDSSSEDEGRPRAVVVCPIKFPTQVPRISAGSLAQTPPASVSESHRPSSTSARPHPLRSTRRRLPSSSGSDADLHIEVREQVDIGERGSPDHDPGNVNRPSLLSPRFASGSSSARAKSISLRVASFRQGPHVARRPAHEEDMLSTPRALQQPELLPESPIEDLSTRDYLHGVAILRDIERVPGVVSKMEKLDMALAHFQAAQLNGHPMAGQLIASIYIKLGQLILPRGFSFEKLPEMEAERTALLLPLRKAMEKFKLADRERSYDGARQYAKAASAVGQILIDSAGHAYTTALYQVQILDALRFLPGSLSVSLMNQAEHVLKGESEFVRAKERLEEAVSLLEKSANRNNPLAQFRMGRIPQALSDYRIPIETKQLDRLNPEDLSKLRELARSKHLGAQIVLGLYFLHYSPYSIYAYEWIQSATTLLSVHGIGFENPLLSEQDQELAKAVLKDPNSILHRVDLVVRDDEFDSLRLAFKIGHVDSGLLLVEEYIKRVKKKQEVGHLKEEIEEILKTLTERFDEPKAHYLQGQLMLSETGSFRPALEHMGVAAKAGLTSAFHGLQVHAISLLDAGELPDAWACVNVMFIGMKSITSDFITSIKWFRMAARNGLQIAANYLANLLCQKGGYVFEAKYWEDVCRNAVKEEFSSLGYYDSLTMSEEQLDIVRRIAEDYEPALLALKAAEGKELEKCLFKIAFAAASGHPDASLELGKYYEEKGEKDKAIAWYEISIEGQNDSRAVCFLARLLEESEPQKATQLYELAIQREEPVAYFDYGQFLVSQGKYEPARDLFERLVYLLSEITRVLVADMQRPQEEPKEEEGSDDDWYKNLIQYSKQGLDADSMKFKLSDEIPYLKSYVSLARSMGGEKDQAKMYLGLALKIVAQITRQCFYNLGVLNESTNHMHTAFHYHRCAAELNEPSALYRCGLFWDVQGHHKKAMESFMAGVPLGHAGCTLQVALDAQRASRSGPAELYYRSVLRLEPDNPIAIVNLALLLLSSDPKEAESLFEKGVKFKIPLAASHLASIRLAQNRESDAIELYKSAFLGFWDPTVEGRPSAAYHLACLFGRRGDRIDADIWQANHYYLAAALKGVPAAQHVVGVKNASLGNVKEAEKWLRKAYEAGYEKARRALGVFLVNMPGRRFNGEEMELLRPILEVGKDAEVLYYLGCQLFQPAVEVETTSQAIAYLKKAAELGEFRANQKLFEIGLAFLAARDNPKKTVLYHYLERKHIQRAREIYEFLLSVTDSRHSEFKARVQERIEAMTCDQDSE